MSEKLKKKPGPAPGVYQWRGKNYIGVDAVAAAACVNSNVVSYHLNRHGNLDRLGTGTQRASRHGSSNGKKINILGRCWPSRTALAEELGVHGSTVFRWLRAKKFDVILGALMAAEARRAAA